MKNKKIICILSIILGISLMCGINKKELRDSVETFATPITSHVIIIDAGHGKPDEGAIGLYGTTEEAINLKIALKLQKLLEQSGANVLLTRSDENELYNIDDTSLRQKKISDAKNRVNIINNNNADICVSIHLNKFEDSLYSGWQTFYQPKNEESQMLAKAIQDNISREIKKENNRVPHSLTGVYLMDHSIVPMVVVECGFISNNEECKLLNQDEYQNKIAWGIYIGIQEYFRNNDK